jgi:hypothetical protein
MMVPVAHRLATISSSRRVHSCRLGCLVARMHLVRSRFSDRRWEQSTLREPMGRAPRSRQVARRAP